MAVSATPATFTIPVTTEIEIATGKPSGNIWPGDYLAYSGDNIVGARAAGVAYWKASGAGVAIEAHSAYDQAGRLVDNTALKFVRQGVIRVSAAFSGQPALGNGVYPVTTGSGVNSPTGLTGVGATWQTSVKLPASGSTGAGGSGVAMVIGWDGTRANAGTGQMDILLLPPRPDYY